MTPQVQFIMKGRQLKFGNASNGLLVSRCKIFARTESWCFFQPLYCHGDARSGNIQPAGQSRRDDLYPFAFGFGNRFGIVLFRDGDLQSKIVIRPAATNRS